MAEHTGDSYESIALKYAASVDTRPWNAHYERPAMLSLLPPLAGRKVLDVGCGPGWYAEHEIEQGADVTAFDLNADFVRITGARVGSRARVLQADLSQPLAFAADGEFDVVVCPLVLHYLRDWEPPLRELHRVLKVDGVLVFSTHHPVMDWQSFKRPDYFATEVLEDDWPGIGPVRFYRRPITAIAAALHASGFWIERLVEPKPTDDFKRVDPTDYARLSTSPGFLLVRARKAHSITTTS